MFFVAESLAVKKFRLGWEERAFLGRQFNPLFYPIMKKTFTAALLTSGILSMSSLTAQVTTLVSFDYQGANPNAWSIQPQTHFTSFDSFSNDTCVSPTTLDFAGLGNGDLVGHSGGTIVNGQGLICTGQWDDAFDPNSANVVSFDLTFSSDSSGPLDEFSFTHNPMNGATDPNQSSGFQLSIVDIAGNTVWTSGAQSNGAINTNTDYTFDISSIDITGGETYSFETYAWNQSAYIGNYEVTSGHSLCVPEPSSSLLVLLSGFVLTVRRKR